MDIVEKSFDYRKLLHTHLVLGQTKWVCRHGTLGEGHENITPAQRYYQAIKEAYYLACSIKRLKAMSKKYEADLKESEQEITGSIIEELRSASKQELAELALIENEITIQDQLRQLEEYNTIINELKDEVESRYPQGIEQASPDMWKDRMKYKLEHRLPIANIPLPMDYKDNLIEHFIVTHKNIKQIGVSNV